MEVHTTLDDRICSLVSEVDAQVRTELAELLRTLRDACNPRGVILGLSRLSLHFLDLLFSSVGQPRASDNLFDYIHRAAGGDGKKIPGLRVLPDEIASYLHTIRVLSNKVDHAVEKLALTVPDAEMALGLFLRSVEWLYCEYPNGQCLSTIYTINRIAREALEPTIVGLRFADVEGFFRDRVDKLEELRRFLGDRSVKLIAIVGRGGTGKTALLSKVCGDIERGTLQLLDAGKAVGAEGILYVSCRGGMPTIERLFHGLAQMLGNAQAEEMAGYWGDSTRPLADKAGLLLSRLRAGCYLLALDNVEDVLGTDRGFADPDLREFINLCLATPHALRVLITSRERISLHGQHLRAVRIVSLDAGLPDAEAMDLLRDLDHDAGLGIREADPTLLRQAVQRCYGIPRALESIAGILANDPTLTLEGLLRNTALFNEQVVENLIAAQYRRVTNEQRRVLQALAVYNKPVPAAAVGHVVTAFFADADVEGCLRTLVSNYFVTFQRAHGTYELHPLDRSHAYECLPPDGAGLTRSACHRRAAEYYLTLLDSRTPQSVQDLQPALEAIDHLIRAGDHEAAWQTTEMIGDALADRGLYSDIYRIRSQLEGRLSATAEARNAVALAECLYDGLDRWEEAVAQVERVEVAPETVVDDSIRSEATQIHAHILFDQGNFDQALSLAQQNLRRHEAAGDSCAAANVLNSLGVFVDAIGNWQEAQTYYERAWRLYSEQGRPYEAGCIMINRSVAHLFLENPGPAISTCEEGVRLCADYDCPRDLAYARLNLGIFHLAAGHFEEARAFIELCASWGEKEAWYGLNLKQLEAMWRCYQGHEEDALVLLDSLVQPFRQIGCNWGEVDTAVNRGIVLSRTGAVDEAVRCWTEALSHALECSYYLGTRMIAYLLNGRATGAHATVPVQEWRIEFTRRLLPKFSVLLMPSYVLILRARASAAIGG
jgi:tetratricopeptide (TPR) repeat protein